MPSSNLLAYLVTFTASFCIMVIELVAGRILAPFIGQHLYSWTSIIGVCLAGISLGAWLGGWLVDRFPRRGTLGWILFTGGVLVLLTPVVTDTVAGNEFLKYHLSLMWRIVVYTLLIFLPSTLVLGMVAPTVIRLVLKDVEHTGSVVGRLNALSTLGAIVGTFATGFYLIEEFYTRVLLYAVGTVLILIAPLVGGVFGRLAGRSIAALLVLSALSGVVYYACKRDKYAEHLAWVRTNIGRPVGITTEKVPDLGVSVSPVAEGLRITKVTPPEPKKKTDDDEDTAETLPEPLQVGDVITDIEGRKASEVITEVDANGVEKRTDLVQYVADHGYVGQPLRVKYLRAGQPRQTVANLQSRTKFKFLYPNDGYKYVEETNYYTLRVSIKKKPFDPVTGDQPILHELILDNLIHSHSDPDDPTYLAYEYLQIYEELVGWKLKGRPSTKHRQFFIGGGGYTMQRLFNHKYKDSYIDVAEIDPGVTRVAEEWMKAPKGDPRLVTINQDARLVVLDKYNAGEKYDFIFGDAFNDLSIPFHLTTLEFDRQLNGLLTDDGLVMSLVIDHVGQGHFLPSFLATMRAAFGDDNVALLLVTEPAFRKRLVEYLKSNGLGEFIPRLEKQKLDGLVPEIEEKLRDELAKKPADDILKEYQKTKLQSYPEAEREQHRTKMLAKARKDRLEEIVAGLESRKVDDLVPFLKPAELDHVPHSTVIVVASRKKQNWQDFKKYLDDLEDTYEREKSGRTVASYVLTPEEVTKYLASRTRTTTWVDRLLRRAEPGQDVLPWTPLVLTDDYAPVDNLTAPMFEKRYGYNKSKIGKADTDD